MQQQGFGKQCHTDIIIRGLKYSLRLLFKCMRLLTFCQKLNIKMCKFYNNFVPKSVLNPDNKERDLVKFSVTLLWMTSNILQGSAPIRWCAVWASRLIAKKMNFLAYLFSSFNPKPCALTPLAPTVLNSPVKLSFYHVLCRDGCVNKSSS